MFQTPEGSKQPKRYRVDEFPVGSEIMNVLMKEIMREVAASEQLRKKLYQVGFRVQGLGLRV